MSNPAFVLPLADATLTLATGGGKAVNLGAMLRAGLPVPDGAVVTTEAYRSFVAANGLAGAIDAAWVHAADPTAVEAASAQLRIAFEAGVVPPAIADALRAAWAQLGPQAVAVRSSATAEDLPDASFAGQQDTYLNVRGADAVADAVRRCWGSLWTARAMAYRARQGIRPEDVALAVVVQRMAPATAAGVMFTVHPVTGRADRAVINATWGLGEALVSGRVNPDTLVVEKASGAVLRVELGDKAVMTAETATGTAEAEVSAERRAQRALTDAQAAALARHGVALEALFGGPQDVEWAVVEGGVVLLQSRAITTMAPAIPGDDAWPPIDRGQPWPFDVWTQQDMGERWPEPVTPLTWSISEPMNQAIMDGMLDGLQAPYAGKVRWSLRAFGRVWMNEGALLHAYCQGMGMPLAMMRSGLTHPAAKPVGPEGWQLGPALRHMGFFWKAMSGWEKNVDRFEAAFPQIDAWVDTFMARDLTATPEAALLPELLDTWFPRLLTYVAMHTNATSLSMSSYDELEGVVVKAGGDSATAQELMGGISGVIAAEMVPSLAAMAALLRVAGLVELVTGQPPAAALAALRADPRAAPFLQELAAFLQRHGHRAATEGELRFPRWSEAPELVIEQLLPYLRGSATPTSQGAADRREATSLAFRGKLGWFNRMAFDRALPRAQRFTRMRDNGQGYVVKLLMPIRVLLAELGRRLVAAGALRTEDDVWFLVREDLASATAANPSDAAAARAALQARADARRAAHTFWLSQTPPDALDTHLEPVPPPAPAENGDPNTLVGVPASRGTVTGTARVIATPQDAARLQPGDILVTRATDPGWTPVFSVIGGAVLEIGGLLSHGAIVAREYGLPAVVNVPQCTRRIHDGQRITVNGTTGRVTIEG